jgi:hypothetical protein
MTEKGDIFMQGIVGMIVQGIPRRQGRPKLDSSRSRCTIDTFIVTVIGTIILDIFIAAAGRY